MVPINYLEGGGGEVLTVMKVTVPLVCVATTICVILLLTIWNWYMYETASASTWRM